jgi:hypothetical protein
MTHLRTVIALVLPLVSATACDRNDVASNAPPAPDAVVERSLPRSVEVDGLNASMTFVLDDEWMQRHRGEVAARKAALTTVEATLAELDRLDAECQRLTSETLGPRVREYMVVLDVAVEFGPDAVKEIDRRIATLADGGTPPRWAIHVLSRIGGDDAAYVATRLPLSKPTKNERLAAMKLADSSPRHGERLRRSIGGE